jgi:hypothetical protein
LLIVLGSSISRHQREKENDSSSNSDNLQLE